MSVKTWKEEFYPTDAVSVQKEDALAHSLRKWEGMRKANLIKHEVIVEGRILFDDSGDVFSVDGRSCALCRICSVSGDIDEPDPDEEAADCSKCPLQMARGGYACDAIGEIDMFGGEETQSPWESFEDDGNPEPMIFWLLETMSWALSQ